MHKFCKTINLTEASFYIFRRRSFNDTYFPCNCLSIRKYSDYNCFEKSRIFCKKNKMADGECTFNVRARNRLFKGLEEEKEKSWKGPFTFIQAADTQFGMIEGYIQKKVNISWEEEIKLTRKAIQAANKMSPKPRFFIVCGDLIDAMPGTQFRAPQEKDFKRVFTELDSDIPLVCVCGNHDVGNMPTPESVKDYCEKFGDDYFTFWCSGVMFIVLNSQFYKDPQLVQDLAKEQDTWLDKQLQKGKNCNYKHIIVFQHIPWFLQNADEDDEYFNIDVEIRKMMLDKFIKAGVKAIFCGHYHRNAGGVYRGMEVVVTSAIGAQLGNDQSGLRVVSVLENTIDHTYYALDDIPTTILLNS